MPGSASGGVVDADPARMQALLALNVTAPTLLAHAALGGMVKRGTGAVINLGLGGVADAGILPGIYSATKSYVLTLSQGLAAEVGQKGVYVQAVLPAATRTTSGSARAPM